jgi:hypothetical protein
MRARTFLAFVAALALAAIPLAAHASNNAPSVTGGGQVMIGERNGGSSAGDTIAFNAQDPSSPKGQVQYVDRSGQTQTVWHGTIDCLVISGNQAYMNGHWTSQGTGPFTLYAQDNGEPNQGADMIEIDQGSGSGGGGQCNANGGSSVSLARGNVQIHG